MTTDCVTWRPPGGAAGCSLCGGRAEEVQIVISARAGRLCRDCIRASHRRLRAELGDEGYPSWRDHAPRAIKAALDEAVIGQEHAKRILSVALYNHYKRLSQRRRRDPETGKSNILLIGPSGSGKTLLARRLAAIAEVPFAIVDATRLTAAGYVGADVESVLLRLLQAAGDDVEWAERGIVYLDEIDKLGRKEATRSGGRDIAGEGVQQALLRMIEGAVVSIAAMPGRRVGRRASLELDTSGILFICGGSFAGLERIVRAREGASPIGYGRTEQRPAGRGLHRVAAADLVAFGFIPELVGRLPIVASLDALEAEQLVAVLTGTPHSPIRQYQQLFRLGGVELRFEKAALQAIARQASARRAGARALQAVIERLLLDLMFALPEHPEIRCVTIDREAVERGTAWPLAWRSAIVAPRMPAPRPEAAAALSCLEQAP